MRPVGKVAAASVVAGGAIAAALALHTPKRADAPTMPTGNCGATVLLDDGDGPRSLAAGETVSGCPPKFTLNGKVYRLVDEDAVGHRLIYRAAGVHPKPKEH